MANIQSTSSGKTSPEHSAPTRARTSSPSSKRSARSKDTKFILLDLKGGQKPERSWQTISVSHGGYLTRNTGEFPNAENASDLVADFAGGSAGKILFESEGVSGYTPQGFRAWQGAAGTFVEGAGTAGRVCLNDQGGSRMDVMEDVTATLRAENHGHPPCVMSSAGFCTEHSAKAGGIGYEEETSPTLRAGTVPAAVYENHSQDTRYTGPLETAPTVNATYGMGGNNQPFVVETPKTLKIRSGCDGGGKGALIQDNKSATLGCNNDQTVFVPKVYGICSKQSHSMLSDNPHSGFYEAETSRCLDANGGNPSCNQGGMAVLALQGSMIGRADKNWRTRQRRERRCIFYAGCRRPPRSGLLYDRWLLHPNA